MAKQLLAFVALLVLQGLALSATTPESSASLAFEKWLATFDPSTAVASKAISCTGQPNGLYPDSPDTCTGNYFACLSGSAYPSTCDGSDVFDAKMRDCVAPYVAKSDACYYNYPAPTCTANNLNEYQPTGRCSELYFICFSAGANPQYGSCGEDKFFDKLNPTCQDKGGAICDEPGPDPNAPPPPPAVVPPYGCGSDKISGVAYAISPCSVSFYTCERTISSSPIPGSCSSLGAAGTVFNYRASPQAPTPANAATLCLDKLTVPECL